MNLSETDTARFYNIWLTLLDYTNSNYNIDANLKDLAHSSAINTEDLMPIKERLWKDDTILEEFVSLNPMHFSEADLAIVCSWKNRVSDKFILLKHLKNYSIFLGNDHAYGVCGIATSFEDMFPSFLYTLPIMLDAVLLPFEGKIIYDSLLISFPVHFGGGAKQGFQEQYRDYKQSTGIITTLE